ncbi:hypothetical protein INR49_008767 [Caranx melampygus]|nr:hypothetical protein INR49_008767 [Caranx melampygus]
MCGMCVVMTTLWSFFALSRFSFSTEIDAGTFVALRGILGPDLLWRSSGTVILLARNSSVSSSNPPCCSLGSLHPAAPDLQTLTSGRNQLFIVLTLVLSSEALSSSGFTSTVVQDQFAQSGDTAVSIRFGSSSSHHTCRPAASLPSTAAAQ